MKMRRYLLITALVIAGTINISFGQETTKQDSLQNAYTNSGAFKVQVSKAQLASGGILLCGSIGMITGGIFAR